MTGRPAKSWARVLGSTPSPNSTVKYTAQAGKDVVLDCMGLAVASDGRLLVLVHFWGKSQSVSYDEVLLLSPDWKLVQTVRLPLLPSWKGISAMPDGGFLVPGTLSPGIAAVLRADADGHYRCW